MTSAQSFLSPAEALEIMRSRPVLVAGAGVAGRGVVSMLHELGAEITVADDHVTAENAPDPSASYITVEQAVRRVTGDEPPALVITSPGWRPDSLLLVSAHEFGVPVIGDIEAAWLADQAEAFGPTRRWMAITGTNGKTTTTAMLTAMFVADGQAAVAVGNIGTPPGVALTAEAAGNPRVDVLVAEVSSFQLHWAPSFRPDVGCLLNLAEDHLDWHGSFDNYADDKAHVLRAGTAVIPAQEPEVWQTIERLHRAPAQSSPPWDCAYAFSTTSELGELASTDKKNTRIENTVTVTDGWIVETDASGEQRVLASAEGISPPGPAGVADAAAAAAMARSAGVDAESIATALKNFTVQAHRGQIVYNSEGITWIDNSKATNPHAAAAALRGQSNVVWVAGGQLKGASVTELIEEIKDSLKAVVVLGVDRQVIADAVDTIAPSVDVAVVDSTDPHEAMQLVVRAARQYAAQGDSVILAPAAASLDMYSGMSQRGDLFAEYAMKGN